MILTCPKCASRFMLAAQILAPKGKRVKCSSCGETWFELPDPDELLEDIEKEDSGQIPPLEEIPDDIPESVKPLPEGSSVPALADDSDDKPQKKPAKTRASLLVSILIAAIFASPLLLMKNTIMDKWPVPSPCMENSAWPVICQERESSSTKCAPR